jgi:hypothetical protein
VPDAGTRRIHVAALRGRSAARPVAEALRALHRADERGFLQQAVAAHAAAEKGPFGPALQEGERALGERRAAEPVIGRLEASSWCQYWHRSRSVLAGYRLRENRSRPHATDEFRFSVSTGL